MVERRITDGRRIAELLASEVEGRRDGPFEHLTVIEADRDAEPSSAGTRAYAVAVAADRDGGVSEPTETADGSTDGTGDDGVSTVRTDPDRLATIFLHPDHVRVDVLAGRAAAKSAAASAGLTFERADGGSRVRLVVESGAAVKRATDALAAAVRDIRVT